MKKLINVVTDLNNKRIERKNYRDTMYAIQNASSPGLRDDLVYAWQRNNPELFKVR